MKKTILTILLVIFIFAVHVAAIQISEDNPRWFNHKRETICLMTSGQNGIPKEPLLSEMITAGVNTFYIQVQFMKNSSMCPWKGTGSIEKNFGGWNEGMFLKLRSEAAKLQKRGCFLLLVIDGSPLRRLLWDYHLWNQKNGGPVPAGENGVPAFYRYGIEKQKEFLKKLLYETLPESKYSNILVALNWEIFNGWPVAKEWAVDLIDYCHSLNKHRPFGIGTFYHDHLAYLNSKIKRPAFGIAEGADIFKLLEYNSGRKPKYWPWVNCGFHCHPDAIYEQKNTKLKCARFKKGMEKDNLIGAVNNICYMAQHGINPSLPFEHWLHRTGHIEKECKNITYDYQKFRMMLFEFSRTFTSFMKKRNLSRLPGWWQSRKIKKLKNMYIEKIQGLNP